MTGEGHRPPRRLSPATAAELVGVGVGLALLAVIIGLILVGRPAAPERRAGRPPVPRPPAQASAGAPGSSVEINLASDRTAHIFFYRIPALTYLGHGIALAAWDGRPGGAADPPNPNSIVQRRSTDGGKTWGPIQIIAAGHVADSSGPKFGYSNLSYVDDAQRHKVFAFLSYTKDAGYLGSSYGNNDADRAVISSAVISSTDAGATWSRPRLITKVTKPGSSKTHPRPGDVKSNFAVSGAGIQLRYGVHAGRLIQQYVGEVLQRDGTLESQAYSVYSDDHGVSWRRGAPAGTGMNENKTVELSDGRVMLNSRDADYGGYRKVAFSTDGGVHYGQVSKDPELPDPGVNGSITRMFPDAPEHSAKARMLLFTNSNSEVDRANVSARVSCDDGATWPGLRTIRAQFSAYSTAIRLEPGELGVLYEASYVANIRLARFRDAWLNYVCAPLRVQTQPMVAGGTRKIRIRVTNQEPTVLAHGSVTVRGPSGWTAATVPVPALARGASVTVAVAVTAPPQIGPAPSLTAVFRAPDGRGSQYAFPAGPAGNGPAPP